MIEFVCIAIPTVCVAVLLAMIWVKRDMARIDAQNGD
jgi:hypothetical protein